MKTLFFSSKSDLVCSPTLSTSETKSQDLLIAEIYYDSGLDKDCFVKLYLETAKKYFSEVKSVIAEEEVFLSIRKALRKRRYYYMPDGVDAENVHSQKDVWTFATFLSGLLLPVQCISIQEVLKKILDNSVYDWVESKGVLNSLITLNDPCSTDRNTILLRGFYDEKSITGLGENVEPELKEPELKEPELDLPLSNKEMAQECLKWLYDQAKKESEVAYFEKEQLIVKSPGAFVLFGKQKEWSWKGIQKGFIKLGRHEPNPVNGTPFQKRKGINVMVID